MSSFRIDLPRLFVALIAALLSCAAAAADIGAIVLHGKWGSPDRAVNTLADALAAEGILVVSPEMPWSRGRSYDKSVEGADAEVDGAIADLRGRGAKRIFILGHSMGAAHALHYGGRTEVTGIAAIAPGHRPETPRIADGLRADVVSARGLLAAGKGSEIVAFNDFNSGNRTARMTASAVSFLSYFDPDGPMNMTRNVAAVKPGVPILWIVPLREDANARQAVLMLFKRLPAHPDTRLAEPDADHLGAPAASVKVILEWMRKVAMAEQK